MNTLSLPTDHTKVWFIHFKYLLHSRPNLFFSDGVYRGKKLIKLKSIADESLVKSQEM